jgi:hypothetical protein
LETEQWKNFSFSSLIIRSIRDIRGWSSRPGPFDKLQDFFDLIPSVTY